MNDHDLLIEMHTDIKHIKDWTVKHEGQHKEEKSSLWKFLLPLYTALVAAVARLVFWN